MKLKIIHNNNSCTFSQECSKCAWVTGGQPAWTLLQKPWAIKVISKAVFTQNK